MKEGSSIPKLVFEEKKAIKLFMFIIYFSYIAFDILWYFLLPHLWSFETGNINEGLGYWLYILNLSFIPVAVFFIKKDNPYPVKYIILLSYIIIDIVDNLIRYYGKETMFASGNISELFFIIFSPIFVNEKFHWIVSIVIMGKYIFLMAVLQTTKPLSISLLIAVLSAITFILLKRFESYTKSLKTIKDELQWKEKLATIGKIATAIGHEIRNPIASLRGFIQFQKEQYPNTNDNYQIMIQEIDRINSIVNDLMFIGKPRAISFNKVKINEVIDYTLSVIQQQAKQKNVKIESVFEEKLPDIECDENQLKQVFINLINIAIEAMPNGGVLRILVNHKKDSHINITIEDEFCGISREIFENLAAPFYKANNDGTGLALMVSKQIISDHHGEIKIDSKQGKGTKIILKLPVKQKLQF
ncbi:ATP-binding protein [Bacillus sp. JJ1764]|uniref:ATP-binding protein n=1 Tax=Bacillus sp. JJ1764 TaxID=3122964 RepID=UPI002FFEEADF